MSKKKKKRKKQDYWWDKASEVEEVAKEPVKKKDECKSKSYTKDSNILGVKSKIYDKCDYCSSEVADVLHIPYEIYGKWLYINSRYPSLEWLGVYWVKDNKVDKFYLPKQEVAGAECEMLEDVGGNGIVHWHHSMGAFHSGQDDKHCRNIYDYSIVLSTSGYDACRKVKLPCGGFHYRKMKLIIDGVECDVENIQERSKKDEVSEYYHDYYSRGYARKSKNWVDASDILDADKKEKEADMSELDSEILNPHLEAEEIAALMEKCDNCSDLSGDSCLKCEVRRTLYGDGYSLESAKRAGLLE